MAGDKSRAASSPPPSGIVCSLRACPAAHRPQLYTRRQAEPLEGDVPLAAFFGHDKSSEDRLKWCVLHIIGLSCRPFVSVCGDKTLFVIYSREDKKRRPARMTRTGVCSRLSCVMTLIKGEKCKWLAGPCHCASQQCYMVQYSEVSEPDIE